MKPSKLKRGQKVQVKVPYGWLDAYFLYREPRRGQIQAKNYLRFPEYAGLDGPEDDGTCVMSDYDLSRKGRIAAR